MISKNVSSFLLLACFASLVISNTSVLYDLIPGRYPDAISLPRVIKELPKTQQGQAAIERILSQFCNTTGVDIPKGIIDAGLEDPSKLLKLFVLNPHQYGILAGSVNFAYHIGTIPPPSNTTPIPSIPNPFHFPSDVANIPLNLSSYHNNIHPLGLNDLYVGYIYSGIPKTQLRNNVLFSLLLQRLGDNAASPSNNFTVIHRGSSHNTIVGFLHSLLNTTEYSLDIHMTRRVAEFTSLFLGTHHDNGTISCRPIPSPTYVSTGFYDDDGMEAKIPAIHSEWIINVDSDDFSARSTWFEGTDGVGFHPDDTILLETWVGKSDTYHMSGASAADIVQHMGVYGSALNSIARTQHLWDGGYAMTGVCDDSCTVIEHLVVNGRNHLLYPNLMVKKLVLPPLKSMATLNDGGYYERYYENLVEAVKLVPEDRLMNDLGSETAARAASTLDLWKEGEEPFNAIMQARKILLNRNKG